MSIYFWIGLAFILFFLFTIFYLLWSWGASHVKKRENQIYLDALTKQYPLTYEEVHKPNEFDEVEMNIGGIDVVFQGTYIAGCDPVNRDDPGSSSDFEINYVKAYIRKEDIGKDGAFHIYKWAEIADLFEIDYEAWCLKLAKEYEGTLERYSQKE